MYYFFKPTHWIFRNCFCFFINF